MVPRIRINIGLTEFVGERRKREMIETESDSEIDQ